jgi:prepilin signal peptidase PulO-like enzyme (type II secretory pathway)
MTLLPHALLAFVFGTIWGSFLSVLTPRLHDDEKGILTGRSHCPNCKRTLRPLDLIPLLSYLLLRGRCRACKERISFWYPVTELVSGLFFATLYMQFQDFSLFLWFTPHFIVLLFIFFYDLRYKEIHDYVLIPGIIYAGLANFFIGDLTSGLIGAAVGFSFFGLQYLLSRGRWIGSGDLRIGLFMGFMLGWPMTFLAILVSYVIGSVISLYLLATKAATPKTAVPLGPFLVLGTVLAFFAGDRILELYLSLL